MYGFGVLRVTRLCMVTRSTLEIGFRIQAMGDRTALLFYLPSLDPVR